MKRFKKKMMTVCMVAMICLGMLCFSGCSVVDVFVVQQAFMVASIFYIEYGDDVNQWFRKLVFPDWAYGAYEEDVTQEGAE